MKFFIFLPAFALLIFSFIPGKHLYKNSFQNNSDTPVINHVLDGSTSEWPANKFEQDKSTGIKYATDNDAANLYIAMIVPDPRTQMKMMLQGMELYVDVKGKKREEKGIAFPVPKTNISTTILPNSAATQNAGKQTPDIKQLRTAMALNLLSLRLIGFSDDDPKDQELVLPGSVNIQYTWDDADIMYIEYSIPMNIFSDNSLNQKMISLGWKLNGADNTLASSTVVTVSRSSSSQSQPTRGRGAGSGNTEFNQADRSSDMMKEQSFWTKYTVSVLSK